MNGSTIVVAMIANYLMMGSIVIFIAHQHHLNRLIYSYISQHFTKSRIFVLLGEPRTHYEPLINCPCHPRKSNHYPTATLPSASREAVSSAQNITSIFLSLLDPCPHCSPTSGMSLGTKNCTA
jgi:hypothetical protein